MELKLITFSGGVKSISDDDLCALCHHCAYRPGEMSGCDVEWPGFESEDGYVQLCDKFEPSLTPSDCDAKGGTGLEMCDCN